jgi:diguanylate cyclase (GGDEF)-like protein/PAS domain S-box-containing protein
MSSRGLVDESSTSNLRAQADRKTARAPSVHGAPPSLDSVRSGVYPYFRMTSPYPESSPENGRSEAQRSSRSEVVLVEVDQPTAQELQEQLGRDITLVTCSGAAQSLSRLSLAPPDLLVVESSIFQSHDWPALRAASERARVPLVALAQAHSTLTREGALAQGAIEYIERPFESSHIAHLRGILELHTRLRHNVELSEARWRFALDGPEFGVRDWDLGSGRVVCSAALTKLLGLPRTDQETSHERWLEWTHPEDRQRVQTAFSRMQSGEKESVEIEYRLGRKDHPAVWVHERGRVLSWENGVPKIVMSVIADTTERRKSERRLVKLTNYDSLTELPNRRKALQFLLEAQARARATGTRACLLRVDLSGLSSTNHSLGRDVGDEIIKQAAARLKAFVKRPEYVCRFVGKEFAVICEELDRNGSVVQAEMMALEVAQEVERPFLVQAETVTCASHVGACLIDEGIHDAEEFIRRAEIALAEAKRARASAATFQEHMLARIQQRARLLNDLELAVFTDRLHVAYQPIVEASGRVIAAEALARWNHSDRGLIPPSEFLPLAEESGLIVPLGARLRRTICAQIASWAESPTTKNIAVSINVSPAEFRADGFVRDFLLLIRSHAIDPRLVQLEFTESLLTGDFKEISGSLAQLHKAGIRLCLDDFGTGYSSLIYLKRLPFERLKLDRSFVRDILTDPIDASLSRAILAMAHNLGLEVIAEGVEEESQMRLLSEMGCSLFHGYLFGRPGAPEEVDAQCSPVTPAPLTVAHSLRKYSFGPPSSHLEVDQSASILIVDDDVTTVQLLRRVLKEYPGVRTTTNPLEAKKMAEAEPPDLILLDTQMPNLDGFDLWNSLRKNPSLADVPAIFVTALLDPETELRALTLGAADFVSKPISAARLKIAVRNQLRIKKQTDDLRKQASVDPLTNVANRRSFDRALAREVARAIESNTGVS